MVCATPSLIEIEKIIVTSAIMDQYTDGEFRVEMQACKKKGMVVMGQLGAYVEVDTRTTAPLNDA